MGVIPPLWKWPWILFSSCFYARGARKLRAGTSFLEVKFKELETRLGEIKYMAESLPEQWKGAVKSLYEHRKNLSQMKDISLQEQQQRHVQFFFCFVISTLRARWMAGSLDLLEKELEVMKTACILKGILFGVY